MCRLADARAWSPGATVSKELKKLLRGDFDPTAAICPVCDVVVTHRRKTGEIAAAMAEHRCKDEESVEKPKKLRPLAPVRIIVVRAGKITVPARERVRRRFA